MDTIKKDATKPKWSWQAKKHYAGICLNPQQIFIVEIKGHGDHWQLSAVHYDHQWDGSHQKLQQYWDDSLFNAQRVAIGIPDDQVISCTVPSPATQNEAEVHAHMSIEVAQLTPLDVSQMAIDYYPIDDHENHYYQIYACPQSWVDAIVNTLSSTQLLPQVITVESLAEKYLADWLTKNSSHSTNKHHCLQRFISCKATDYDAFLQHQSKFRTACGLAIMAMHSANEERKLLR